MIDDRHPTAIVFDDHKLFSDHFRRLLNDWGYSNQFIRSAKVESSPAS